MNTFFFSYPGVAVFLLRVVGVALNGVLEGVSLSSCIISPKISSS